jgi:hypothetical protein
MNVVPSAAVAVGDEVERGKGLEGHAPGLSSDGRRWRGGKGGPGLLLLRASGEQQEKDESPQKDHRPMISLAAFRVTGMARGFATRRGEVDWPARDS